LAVDVVVVVVVVVLVVAVVVVVVVIAIVIIIIYVEKFNKICVSETSICPTHMTLLCAPEDVAFCPRTHSDPRDLKGRGMSLLVPANRWRRHSRTKPYVSVGAGDSLSREMHFYLSEGENQVRNRET
jgi:hypothetical protein